MKNLFNAAIALAPIVTAMAFETHRNARQWSASRWMWILVLVGLVQLASISAPAAFFFALLLLQWTVDAHGSLDSVSTLLTWGGIFATWVLAQQMPVSARPTVVMIWCLWGLVNAGLILLYAGARRGWLPEVVLSWSNEYAGWFGQRTFAAAYLALTFPLLWLAPTPWVFWAGVGFYAAALVAGFSWLALLATGAGLAVVQPKSLWITVPSLLAGLFFLIGARRVLDRWTSRGTSFDSFHQRWAMVVVLWPLWKQHWLIGGGAGTAQHASLIAQAGARYPQIRPGPLHNDVAEHLYDYGLVGALFLGWFLVPVWNGWHLGDPYSAVALTGAVLVLGTYLTQVPPTGLVWWITMAWVTT